MCRFLLFRFLLGTESKVTSQTLRTDYGRLSGILVDFGHRAALAAEHYSVESCSLMALPNMPFFLFLTELFPNLEFPRIEPHFLIFMLMACFLQGTESKIDSETGELCYRGRHIFMG